MIKALIVDLEYFDNVKALQCDSFPTWQVWLSECGKQTEIMSINICTHGTMHQLDLICLSVNDPLDVKS